MNGSKTVLLLKIQRLAKTYFPLLSPADAFRIFYFIANICSNADLTRKTQEQAFIHLCKEKMIEDSKAIQNKLRIKLDN